MRGSKLVVAIGLIGCGSALQSSGDDAAGDRSEPALRAITFTESAADVLNPERGMYHDTQFSGTVTGYARARKPAPPYAPIGYSLERLTVRLDEFRIVANPATIIALSDEFKTNLIAQLAAARAAKIKVVLEFTYNDPTDAQCRAHDPAAADASLAQILGHISSLAPILHDNADVIYSMLGGFVGCWGEWNNSQNQLSDDDRGAGLANASGRRAIVNALLDALPDSRTIQLRAPRYKLEALGGPTGDGDGFDRSSLARIGHHNDCFLASADDYGTYKSSGTTSYLSGSVADWKAFVAQDTRFTPAGGETCPADTGSRQSCPVGLDEMRALHWTFLNTGWYQPALDAMSSCYSEILEGLGYRLSIARADVSERVAPGGVLHLRLGFKNSGFQSLVNPRPLYVAIDDGAQLRTAKLAIDPRSFASGTTTTADVRLRLPADTAPGSQVRVGVWLPDESPGPGGATLLRDIAEYAVRLANDGAWDTATGINWLISDLVVDPGTTGERDPSASELTAL